jgi:hypothetical protein
MMFEIDRIHHVAYRCRSLESRADSVASARRGVAA